MRFIYGAVTILALTGAGLAAAGPAAAQDEELRRERAVIRATSGGWFGFSFMQVRQGEERAQHVVVMDVEPNSGAARGGLQQGDTIVRWRDRSDVNAAILARPATVGDTVRLRVRRGGRDRDLAIVAGERPRPLARGLSGGRVFVVPEGDVRILNLDSLQINADSLHRRLRVMLNDSLGPRLREIERLVAARGESLGARSREIEARALELRASGDSLRGRAASQVLAFSMHRGVAGAELTDLNPELASYFGTGRGVLVLRVVPDTPAARAGLEAGDVLTRVDGQEISAVTDVTRAVARASGRTVELSVVRKNRPRTVRMTWE